MTEVNIIERYVLCNSSSSTLVRLTGAGNDVANRVPKYLVRYLTFIIWKSHLSIIASDTRMETS